MPQLSVGELTPAVIEPTISLFSIILLPEVGISSLHVNPNNN